jgi:formylglycine-generating enzyme required for sulfatase activity
VTWHDAEAYARWVDGDLPTEARWEWAARGPERRVFPWGDGWDRNLCCCAEYWAKRALNDYRSWETWFKGIGAEEHDDLWSLSTSVIAAHLKPVGSYPAGASWCGALDMAGNVWEWCADWYEESYYGSSPAPDPPGPASGGARALRGGAWRGGANRCRSAARDGRGPALRGDRIGFRIARSCR